MIRMIYKVSWEAIMNNKCLYREIYLLYRQRSNKEGCDSPDIVVDIKMKLQIKQLSYGYLLMVRLIEEEDRIHILKI